MYNNTEQCCLSCGTDITNKRNDAKYCSDRCRMRYRRNVIKGNLIEELIQIFIQLPNHYAHRTQGSLLLGATDATGGNHQTWGGKDLKNMSISRLKAFIKEKKVLLQAEKVKNWWLNLNIG